MQFLDLQEVLEIHRDQLSRYGGAAGNRDLDLLKSALGMSGATFNGEFLHTDVHEMAAAYLFQVVQWGELGKSEVTVFLRRWSTVL